MDPVSHTVYPILLSEQRPAGQQYTPAPRKQKKLKFIFMLHILNKIEHRATETARGRDSSVKST